MSRARALINAHEFPNSARAQTEKSISRGPAAPGVIISFRCALIRYHDDKKIFLHYIHNKSLMRHCVAKSSGVIKILIHHI